MERIFQSLSLATAISVSVVFCVFAEDKPSEKPADALAHPAEVKSPDELNSVYKHLVEAFQSGDEAAMKAIILSNTVEITTETLSDDWQERENNINIPFVKTQFDSQVQFIRQDDPDVYLIRTSSSYLFFVQTQQMGWKLFKYGDKPIE